MIRGLAMRYKILVVDDTMVIREFLREVLTDEGFEVDLAEDGQEGYQMALQKDYNIIFCDVHMPVMSGIELVRKLKQVKPEVSIIMTDSFPDKMADKATQAGAICCLAKPFALNELRDIINRAINAPKTPAK
jgi:CheY-like chemotaxis protein